MRAQQPCRSKRQRGLSLIEVLVSIVILSLGLLGVAGMQAAGLRASQGAHYRAQAAVLAYDMAERVRGHLNTPANWNLALNAGAPSGGTRQDLDRADWLNRLATTLPQGAGSINVDLANNVVTIVVQWDDSRAGGPADANFTLTSRLWNLGP
jgi:type IV pilus assembly protein PilV